MTVRAPGRAGRFAPRPVSPPGWWPDLVLLAGFVAVTGLLALAPIRSLDLAVRDLSDAHRPGWAENSAELVNRFGSGGLLAAAALLIAVVVGLMRRSPWPIAPVVAAFLLIGIVIQPLKLIFHRAAPRSTLPDDIEVRLFSQAEGVSYPSGHAVNTIVWYSVICLLLAPWLRPALRTWVRWVPPVVVGFTATYLGYHWLTDMLAGLTLGVLIDRAIARSPWPALHETASGA